MTTRIVVVGGISVLLLACGGCGGDEASSENGSGQVQQTQARRQAALRRAVLRHRALAHARRVALRRQTHRVHQMELHRARAEAAEEREQSEERAEEATPEEGECDPNYTGACLSPSSSDYDCEGGSGNGPDYTGEVSVVGEDHYGLDADGDGIGCES